MYRYIWGEVTSKSLLRVTGLSHRLISHTCERQLNSIWKAYEKCYPFLSVSSHGFELVKIFNNWSWLFCSYVRVTPQYFSHQVKVLV